MKQLIANHRVISHFFKGLLLLPIYVNSTTATEIESYQAPLLLEENAQEAEYFPAAKNFDSLSATVTECPRGFNHSGIQNICVAEDLSLNIVTELASDNRCLSRYEKMIGTQFCLKKNHYLSANKDFYLVGGVFNNYCPENYSRPPESDICVQIELSLIELNHELKLMAPTDGTGVPPDEATGLFAAPPVECEPGFVKPPGFHFCIAINIANHAEPAQYEFDIPVGECPKNWSRKTTNGFCLPENYLQVCGIEFPCNFEPGDSFRISKVPVACPNGFLYKQVYIPTHTHSSKGGFTSIPAYACVPPDKFNE